MQSRREAATRRTMTASANLYSNTRRTPQNATGAVKQGETKKRSASNSDGGAMRGESAGDPRRFYRGEESCAEDDR